MAIFTLVWILDWTFRRLVSFAVDAVFWKVGQSLNSFGGWAMDFWGCPGVLYGHTRPL